MFKKFGHRNWWPAKSKNEMIIDALLVQNVSWKNTKIAIDVLLKVRLLDFKKISSYDIKSLAEMIRSTRFYNQKVKSLLAFADFLKTNCNWNLNKLQNEDNSKLRNDLLKVRGIGPETVDSAPSTEVIMLAKVTYYGCFWHKCPKCFKKPKSNISFWNKKISDNIARDKSVNKKLKGNKIKTLRFWEHEVRKNTLQCFRKIQRTIKLSDTQR